MQKLLVLKHQKKIMKFQNIPSFSHIAQLSLSEYSIGHFKMTILIPK